MEPSKILGLRNGFVRRARLAWGVPMAIVAPIGLWHESNVPPLDLAVVAIVAGAPDAGSCKAALFFATLASAIFFFAGQLFAEAASWLMGPGVVERVERRARTMQVPRADREAQ